ncbi:CsbD-like protein [[Synechococcus] sp. NIES-970]|nr:CsbD-like protein [[Synechococcus] sp. NIES-970]
MSFFKQFFRFLFIAVSTLVATVLFLNFGYADNAASASTLTAVNPALMQSISMNRMDAMGKQIEGKTQEVMGNITGDPKDQLMGKAKQVESQVRNTVEDVKDSMMSGNRAKAIQKNIEGKTQESIGNVTGNRQDQFSGQAKQLESNVRNVVEDAVNGIFK